MAHTKTDTIDALDGLLAWKSRCVRALRLARTGAARLDPFLFAVVALVVLAGACACSKTAMAAPKMKVLYTFANVRGADPRAGLLADSLGNLYGTTYGGGATGKGTVFELSPPAPGSAAWTETVLFSFGQESGAGPSASLISDGEGNLYGTTQGRGIHGDGAVFELSPPAVGQTAWTETVLYAFRRNEVGGENSVSSLLRDGAGNLYGTSGWGPRGDGFVFELSPPAEGQAAWKEKVLHAFSGADGLGPEGGLVEDGAGNFYGTTVYGGATTEGAVFEMSPPAPGKKAWTEKVLFSFNEIDGYAPRAGLTIDAAGNLYGTTSLGGDINNSNCMPYGCGVTFELSPPTQGQNAWTETVIETFTSGNGDDPTGTLLRDVKGNLYGTTAGPGFDSGLVFELTPPAKGQIVWSETVLLYFDGANGSGPGGGVISDNAGKLYGTTSTGGRHDEGVIFRLNP